MSPSSDLLLSSRLRRGLWIFLGLVLVARLAMLAGIPITDNSESRYAEMARHMTVSGDWLTPWFAEGVPFWAKPPLSMWVSAAGIRLFGENEFGARFFIFALAAGMLALGYRWLARHRGANTALAGTVILSTCLAITVVSGAVMTDLTLCFGTTLAMLAFYDALQGEPGRRLPGWLFFAGLAIGLLAKGPVALVLAGLPIGAWVALHRRWSDTWRRLPWISGTLAMLLVVAPWYVLAERRTPGFLHYFLVGEHFGRFLIKGWTGDLYGKAHAETIGMIWVFGFFSLCPWALALPVLLFRGRAIRRQLQQEKKRDGLFSYLACWFLAPLIFFTPARNIISTYALTGIPAGAWLLVECWRLAHAGKEDARATFRLMVPGAVLAALMLLGIAIAFSRPPEQLPKPSRRELVRRAMTSPEFAGAHLCFLESRSFSAEFYSHGQAELIPAAQVETLLDNHRRDLLAVREPADKRFTGPARAHFTRVAKIGDEVLFLESPNPPDDIRQATK